MIKETCEFVIEKLTAENIDEATIVRLNSWVDTYVNSELGITKEWIGRSDDGVSIIIYILAYLTVFCNDIVFEYIKYRQVYIDIR